MKLFTVFLDMGQGLNMSFLLITMFHKNTFFQLQNNGDLYQNMCSIIKTNQDSLFPSQSAVYTSPQPARKLPPTQSPRRKWTKLHLPLVRTVIQCRGGH